MKRLFFQLVLPLTIISFAIFTKWWYGPVTDVGHEVLYGFPLPYQCRGFHTSLSIQFFVLEGIFDFMVYLLFWFLLIYSLHRRMKLKINRWIAAPLVIMSLLIVSLSVYVMSFPEQVFHWKRPFGFEVEKTGYHWIWNDSPRPYQPPPPPANFGNQ